MSNTFSGNDRDKPKQEKFDFEKMKTAATHQDSSIRKKCFTEYFERFAEFPTYLFDLEPQIDARLVETIDDILRDPATTIDVRKGIDVLLARLPSA